MKSSSFQYSEKAHPGEVSHRRRDGQAQLQPYMMDRNVKATITLLFEMRICEKEEDRSGKMARLYRGGSEEVKAQV